MLINYSKQIRLAQTLSFEYFHCSCGVSFCGFSVCPILVSYDGFSKIGLGYLVTIVRKTVYRGTFSEGSIPFAFSLYCHL